MRDPSSRGTGARRGRRGGLVQNLKEELISVKRILGRRVVEAARRKLVVELRDALRNERGRPPSRLGLPLSEPPIVDGPDRDATKNHRGAGPAAGLRVIANRLRDRALPNLLTRVLEQVAQNLAGAETDGLRNAPKLAVYLREEFDPLDPGRGRGR